MLEIIKELCKDNGISIRRLEQLLGFGNATIQRWEESTPNITKVIAVADYFGVTIDALCGREPLHQRSYSPELDRVLMQLNTEGLNTLTLVARGLLSQPEYKKSGRGTQREA